MQIFQMAASDNIKLMKEQQSIMNGKLDTLTKDANELRENVDATRGDIETLRLEIIGIKEKESLFHSRTKEKMMRSKPILACANPRYSSSLTQHFTNSTGQILFNLINGTFHVEGLFTS